MRVIWVCICTVVWAQTWQNVAGGTNWTVNTLLSFGGYLYVGGSFTAVDGTALQAQGIARWTGTAWQAIANPGAGGNGRIQAMTIYQGKLIVGGSFSGIGGTSANNLAAYDPNSNTWSSVGGGVNGEVQALYVYGGELLVGGTFTRVGLAPNDQAIASFARWDGTSWKAPDPTNPSQLLMGGNPLAFAEFNSKLYVGGNFTAAYYNETDKAYLAIWDKATQRLLPAYATGQGPNQNVWALAVWNNKLYIGGEFSMIGGVAAPRLATLSGTTYQAVSGSPTSGRVQVLLPSGSNLYVAGNFTSAGGQTVNRVAALSSNHTWSPLGNGLGPTIVSALALYNGALYAGGNFTQSGSGAALAYLAVYGGPANLTTTQNSPYFVNLEDRSLTVRAKSTLSGRLRLIDAASARVLWEDAISLRSGESYQNDLCHLPAGLYVLSLESIQQSAIWTTKLSLLP